MTTFRSFVKNCVIIVRDGDEPIFSVEADGSTKARLNGYAVLPIEQYQLLSPRRNVRDKIRVGILAVLGVAALVCITAAVYIRIFVIRDATDIWRPRSVGLMIFGSFLCFTAAWVTRLRNET